MPREPSCGVFWCCTASTSILSRGAASACRAPGSGRPAITALAWLCRRRGSGMRGIALACTAVAAGLAVAAIGVAGCGPVESRAVADQAVGVPARQLDRSVANAYSFLSQMMDRYAAGTTPRLVQSFTGGVLGQQHFTASETYDDALLIDAYLAAGTAAARSRARVIGDGLLYVQANDPRHDGRVRAAYAPTPLRSPADVTATDPATLWAAWRGPARPSSASTRPRAGGPTSRPRKRSGTESRPTVTTRAGQAGTRAARPRTARRSGGSPPSTTLTFTPSSGCSPPRQATRPGRPGRGGPDASS